MFDELSRKLDGALKKLRQRGVLTEPMIKEGLREVRRVLLEADVNFQVTRDFLARVQERALGEAVLKAVSPGQQIVKIVHDELARLLGEGRPTLATAAEGPTVILLVGLQGSGKTTSAAKLAWRLGREGTTPMLAACDLQRPAAIEQLQVWGERNKIGVIAQHTGSDSASVIFDGLQAAKARGADVLIADTAGRLHNKDHLMDELAKVKRVLAKLDADAPHEVMLVLDAGTGQNAISQTKLFDQAVGLTGLTLTKLDGTAKGGVIFALAKQFGLPIRFIGVGEQIDDLRPFTASDFVAALFGQKP